MISRYLLKSFLTLWVAILLVSVLVIVIIELMLNFDDLLAMSGGALGIATYLFLRLPAYYLPYLVPASTFAAAFFALGLAARAHEVLAIKAGGISVQRIVVPILVTSALLSGVMLVLNETIVLDASKEFNRLSRRQGGTDVFMARGLFWYHRGDFIYNVKRADSEQKLLHGVRIFELGPDGRLARSYMAETVQIGQDQSWQLQNAAIRTFDPDDPAEAPTTELRRELTLEVTEARDLALLGADPGSLPLWKLGDYIDSLRREGDDVTRYRTVFHARLAEPLAVAVFALIAVPLGLAVERSKSLAVAGLQGIAILGSYYGIQTFAGLFGSGGIEAAVFSPWIVLGAFAGFGAWRFARVPR
jgi:lipopolysaccharide export system permease protein